MKLFPAALIALFATPALATEAPTLDLVAPIAEYKFFVSEKTEDLVADTRAFTEAVKAGDIEKAKALFAPTRLHFV